MFYKQRNFIMNKLTNITKKYEIILASQSQRRINLLKLLNLDFEIESADINENIDKSLPPVLYSKTLAERKAKKIAEPYKGFSKLIIGADTIVVLDNKIINKPLDEDEAFFMLKSLSNRFHFVYTGLSIINTYKNTIITDYSRTCVHFRELEDKEILEYISNGKTLDKAGSYGIQDDYGALFVKRIEGCYNNVIGLPLELLYRNLLKII